MSLVDAQDGTALLVGAEAEGREFIGLLDPTSGEVARQVRADTAVNEVVADDTIVAIVRSGSVTVHDRSTGDQLQRLTAASPTVVNLNPLLIATGDQLTLMTDFDPR